MDQKKINELIRQELGIFSVKNLEETYHRLEDLSGRDEEEFGSRLASVKTIIDDIIKYGIWIQYDLLAKFDTDYSMLAKGGINFGAVIQDFIHNIMTKYEADLKEKGESFDEHSPLGE